MAAQFWLFFEDFFLQLVNWLDSAEILGYSILGILLGCGILTFILNQLSLSSFESRFYEKDTSQDNKALHRNFISRFRRS